MAQIARIKVFQQCAFFMVILGPGYSDLTKLLVRQTHFQKNCIQKALLFHAEKKVSSSCTTKLSFFSAKYFIRIILCILTDLNITFSNDFVQLTMLWTPKACYFKQYIYMLSCQIYLFILCVYIYDTARMLVNVILLFWLVINQQAFNNSEVLFLFCTVFLLYDFCAESFHSCYA